MDPLSKKESGSWLEMPQIVGVISAAAVLRPLFNCFVNIPGKSDATYLPSDPLSSIPGTPISLGAI